MTIEIHAVPAAPTLDDIGRCRYFRAECEGALVPILPRYQTIDDVPAREKDLHSIQQREHIAYRSEKLRQVKDAMWPFHQETSS